MLEKLEDPRFVSISKPGQHALNLLDRVLDSNSAPVICEVGIGIGATSVELCRRLDNRGVVYFFDYQEKLDDLKADIDALGYTNTVWVGNSRRTFDSYSWKLSRLLMECRTLRVPGLFDFAFLDGAHAFHHDAPAALALKELLKPDGYLLFDDYDWSFRISPTMNPDVNPGITKDYSDDQIEASHVRLVCDIFFDPDPQFESVDIGYRTHEHRRAYRKLPTDSSPSQDRSAVNSPPAGIMPAGKTPVEPVAPPVVLAKQVRQEKPLAAPASPIRQAAAPPAKRAGEPVGKRTTRQSGQQSGQQVVGPVLTFGTFDVQTFGDLLFPLIARHRLAERGIYLTAVSPTGAATGWSDSIASIPFDDVIARVRASSAILIGGGNIVHLGPANLADYRTGDLFNTAYPRLWLGASLLGALYNKPVLWNAPGVPAPVTETDHLKIVESVLRVADYVSLRDEASVRNLGEAAAEADIHIVPDTAADLAGMWPKSELSDTFRDVINRVGADGDARFMAIHPKQRAFEGTPETLAAQVDGFAAAHGLTPLVVAVSPCHDDHIAARQLARAMRSSHVQFDNPLSLKEIAAVIAHADLYVGASLHGYIAASSYGVPGVIVARPPLPKFSGYLGHIGRPDDLAEDWETAFSKAAEALAEGPGVRISSSAQSALDAHWDRIAEAIVADPAPNPGRMRLVRQLVQMGLTKRSWDWLLAPVLGADSVSGTDPVRGAGAVFGVD